jgi:hypothetical protein
MRKTLFVTTLVLATAATDRLARAIPAARRADRAGMVAALQASAPFSQRASAIARRLGFEACGSA